MRNQNWKKKRIVLDIRKKAKEIGKEGNKKKIMLGSMNKKERDCLLLRVNEAK